MTFLPYTSLFIGLSHTIATAGSHVLFLENFTGDVSSRNTLEDDVDVLKSGPIRCVDVDRSGRHIITVGEDKILKLWEMEKPGVLRLMNRRELPKKPTAVRFTRDGQTILVSDKFGDVFSYPLPYEPPPQDIAQPKQKDALSSHENPSNGILVLGHASPLNCFVLTADERYIITADRDEHIRVSHFPKGYIIEMYCLGHSKFVSALHIPPTEPALLISGGGDAEIKVWDWIKGILKWELRIFEVVERFLVVKAVRQSEWGEEEEDRDSNRKRRQREKGKTKSERAGDDGGGEQEMGMPVFTPSKVLVVQQVESIVCGLTMYILFTAVGATALFAFPLKPDVQPSEIFYFDFRKPILGFSVVEDGGAVVYLDVEWTDSEVEDMLQDKVKNVRVVRISSGDKFTEYVEFKKELIESLNSKALIPATITELKLLDHYSALRTLPKPSLDQEMEETLLPVGAPELSASKYKARAKAQRSKDATEETEMSKKEIGRMKGKMKVLKKAKEQDQGSVNNKDLARKRDEESDVEKDIVKKLRVEVK